MNSTSKNKGIGEKIDETKYVFFNCRGEIVKKSKIWDKISYIIDKFFWANHSKNGKCIKTKTK